MNDVEFVLPGKAEDLCALIDGQYVVGEVSSGRELTGDVLGLRQAFQEDGIQFIFKHFDTFYSLIKHFETADERMKSEAIEIIFRATRKMTHDLNELLNEGIEELNESQVRFKCRNMMKMYVYILCKLAETYETEALKPSLLAKDVKKGRKKKKSSYDSSWDLLRTDFVQCIEQLYQLPINKLWDPPIVEMEFVNMVTLSFFKILENTLVSQDRELCDRIIEFLGHSVKTYKNELGYAVKIIQLVQDHSHLASILSKAVHIFVEKYGAKFIISRIIKELSCLEAESMLHDTARAQSLSQFIVELATRCPKEVLASVTSLLIFLEEESHVMRNCVLSVIGELIINIASLDEIDIETAETRDELIEKLLEHIHDLSAFVRSKALQISCNLLKETAIPVKMHNLFLERACSRAAKDKSSLVRKNGIIFLKTFLLVNPYCAQLDVKELKNSYDKENDVLQNMMPQCLNASQRRIIDFDSDDDVLSDGEKNEVSSKKSSSENSQAQESTSNNLQDNYGKAENPLLTKESSVPSNENGVDSEPADKDVEQLEEISKQQILVQYLKRTLEQAELLIGAVPKLSCLLRSKTVTDVLEAIDFFTNAFQLGLKEAVVGIKAMMCLIHSKEPAIKNAVVSAYKTLYLTAKDGENKITAAELMAKNLILFIQGASETEVHALTEFVKDFVKNGDITEEILAVLWDMFTQTLPDTSNFEQLSSVIVLSMAASADRDIVIQGFNTLVSHGLGNKAENDFQLVSETCVALMKINGHRKSSETYPEFRLPPDNLIFARLKDILVHGVTNMKSSQWCPMAQRAVELIFSIADHPDSVCENIIHKIGNTLIVIWDTENHSKKLASAVFCRYLFLVGHVAYCAVTFCETDVFSELKRRELIKREELAKEKAKVQVINEEDKENAEMAGLEADDIVGEFINKIMENEFLADENVLGLAYPLVVNTCKWSLQNFHKDICAAASLALGKFMFIRADVCKKNMQLLVTLMEKSPAPHIRSNLIICMADLIKRFPNEVEPWTPHMYKRLRDEDSAVRMNTVTVLMHLILRDMIKVKGQIREIATCIVDPREEISKVAKHLFLELSKRKNTLFNLLPDVISGLSDSSSQLKEEEFQSIIRYLFKFIEKDRQIENLVEKLCHRFKDADETRQVHELAFSMELLNFNDKCFRKLVENKGFFKSKLADEVLARSLRNILNNIKKHHPKVEYEVDAFLVELNI